MEVIMICGYPASGKSTVAQSYIDRGFVHLNRDKVGGTVIGLLPRLVAELNAGHDVVLDNLFPTALSRRPFIEAANKAASIKCVWVKTGLEDSQINCLHRMWAKYGRLFMTAGEMRDIKDPGVFPTAVLFKYRNEFEVPTRDEGFADITAVPFKRRWGDEYCNKALIVDYDDTVRRVVGGDHKYPTKLSEIEILPGRAEILRDYASRGYVLLGASNQSGVAKGNLTHERAVECFNHTNKLLGVDIDFVFCPHSVPPVSCYCRKPSSGLAVSLIEKYKLDPGQCIYVGDQTTDKTFAQRAGFQYAHPTKFFV